MSDKNSGREAIPVYVYNDKGYFIRKFISSAEFAKHYGLQRNTLAAMKYYKLISGKDKGFIYKIHDNAFAVFTRIGRDAILNFIKKEKSVFIRKYTNRKTYEEFPVDCYNLNGEIIATFKSEYYLEAFLGKQVKVCSEFTPHFKGDLKFVLRKS